MADLRSLGWLKIGDTEHLLGVVNTNIHDFLGGSAGAVVTSGTGRLPGSGDADANGALIEGAFWFGNGIDQNLRYDGESVRVAMVQAVTDAPTLVTNVGGGDTHPADTFEYRVSFLSADGEPGEAGAIVEETVEQAFEASVQSIPIHPAPASENCIGRRIWRRSGGSIFFRKVADILDNTTTVYVDEVLNIDLGEVLVEENVRTPPLRYWVEHNGRVLGAGNADDPHTLFVTNKFEPFYCPEAPDPEDVLQGTRAKLQGPAAGVITGVHSHGAYGVVFTGGAGYLLQGDAPLEFALSKFSDHGCVADRTICSARDLLIWLGPDAVYAFDGRSVFSVSEDQRATIEAMTAEEQAGAHAFIWRDRYYLCWSTGAVAFDLQYRMWVTLTNWLWRVASVTQYTGDELPRIYAAREGAAIVYQLETGTDDDGDAIPVVWEGKDHDCGYDGREKRIHYLGARFKKGGGQVLVTLKRGSGATIQQVTHDLGHVEQNDETVSRLLVSAVEQARSEFFRLRIESSTTASEFELLSAALHFTLST